MGKSESESRKKLSPARQAASDNWRTLNRLRCQIVPEERDLTLEPLSQQERRLDGLLNEALYLLQGQAEGHIDKGTSRISELLQEAIHTWDNRDAFLDLIILHGEVVYHGLTTDGQDLDGGRGHHTKALK